MRLIPKKTIYDTIVSADSSIGRAEDCSRLVGNPQVAGSIPAQQMYIF